METSRREFLAAVAATPLLGLASPCGDPFGDVLSEPGDGFELWPEKKRELLAAFDSESDKGFYRLVPVSRFEGLTRYDFQYGIECDTSDEDKNWLYGLYADLVLHHRDFSVVRELRAAAEQGLVPCQKANWHSPAAADREVQAAARDIERRSVGLLPAAECFVIMSQKTAQIAGLEKNARIGGLPIIQVPSIASTHGFAAVIGHVSALQLEIAERMKVERKLGYFVKRYGDMKYEFDMEFRLVERRRVVVNTDAVVCFRGVA